MKKTIMKKIAINFLPILLLVLLAGCLFAQTSFNPVNLGPTVNTEYAEVNPVISTDGNTLYFSRVNHPENTFGTDNSQDIWYTTKNADGTWSQAKRLPNNVNVARYNTILSALSDGNTFIISGSFNARGTEWVGRGISVVERIDENTWSNPKPIKVRRIHRKDRGRGSYAYMTPDGELLFFAITPSPNSKRLSIYVSKRVGEWKYSKPKMLSGKVNDGRTNEAPFVTSDKKVLFFASNVDDSKNMDFYYCNQVSDGEYRKWSKPVPVGEPINTANWDSYYKQNEKGSWAYFSSITNSTGKSDIFSVKLFEENPFIKVRGLILNQADQTLMLADTAYRILVNGKEWENIKVDKVAATYEVTLPLGAAYTLKPEMESWNGISTDIDATNLKEYTETDVNLYFTSIPYVLVKGKIVNTRTNQQLPMERNPRILINGEESDSVKFDLYSSAFQALLPLGQKYVFSARVPNFIATVDTVDVTTERSYVEKEIVLNVSSVPWVRINGIAMDNATFTPILGESNPKLVINGAVADSIQIDSLTGAFRVNLPFGAQYKLGIASPSYNTVDNNIDLSTYTEFTTISTNIFAERKDANIATLEGSIINTKTGKPLEAGVKVRLKINGVESDAFRFDTTSSTYKLKLPIGLSYDLTPSVKNFYNKYEPVDLTKVAARTVIPKNFYVTPIEVGQSVNIENIYFETGKSTLKVESFKSLNALVEFLQEYPNVKVEIGGHTDNVGGADINQRISEQRAKEVANYAIMMGIDASRVTSKGYGMTKPKATNKTAAGRAQNRRVEFTITGI